MTLREFSDNSWCESLAVIRREVFPGILAKAAVHANRKSLGDKRLSVVLICSFLLRISKDNFSKNFSKNFVANFVPDSAPVREYTSPEDPQNLFPL